MTASRLLRMHRPGVCLVCAFVLLLTDVVSPAGPLGGGTQAYADDDDDDGGGGGGSRASGGERSFSGSRGSNLFRALRRQFRQERVRKPRRAVQRQAAVVSPGHRPDEIVALGLTTTQVDGLVAQGFQITSRHRLAAIDGEIIKFDPPTGQTLDEARASILGSAPTASVDFNHLYRPESGEACGGKPCVAPSLVGWPGVGAPLGRCTSDGVTIGLIDTAINPEHETFKSSRLEVVRLDPTVKDQSGRQHGTAVASLLVGTGAAGTPGLLPDARLVAVDAFRANNRADAYDLVRAIDVLVARQVSVINMSLSGPENGVLAKAIERVDQKGIDMVAAAGNGGPGAKAAFPAAYDQVIAVTAIDRQKKPYRRANRGDYIDLAAPGVGVWAAASVEGTKPKTGTSFAAPFVTAAVALAKSQGVAVNDIAGVLTKDAEDLGEPGKDPIFGWGLLNARKLCSG